MDRRLSKRIIAVLAALAVTVCFSGCAEVAVNDPHFAQGDTWIYSDMKGSVTKEDSTRLQDDFAAAANKEWILTEGTLIKDSNLSYISDKVSDKKLALIADDSLQSKEAEELKKFADLATDWDYRNKQGLEPLKGYLDSIDAISGIDGFYDWITDIKKNPLGLAPVVIDSNISRLRAFPDELTVEYRAIDLSLGNTDSYYDALLSGLENKEQTDEKVSYVLGKLGYSQDDIDTVLKECYSAEKKIAAIVPPGWDDPDEDPKYTQEYEELVELAGSYPLDKYIRSRGYGNIKHMLGNKKLLKKIAGVCTESNLPGLKSMLKVGYIKRTGAYLDRETLNTFEEISKSRVEKEKPDYRTEAEKDRDYLCAQIKAGGLCAAMDKLYVEKYIDTSTIQELTDLTKEIIDIYKTEIFPNEEWMSEEGKKLSIEKLDAIVLNIIVPDLSVIDYADLNIVSREENGSFLEAYFDSMRYLTAKKGERAGQKYEREQWFPYYSDISTTDTNSCYVAISNSINIYAGILEDPCYHKGMSREELLSGIGAVIGHEITHGFDSGGVLYTKDGIKDQWLPEKDQQAFSDRAGKVSSHYSAMRPYKGSGFYSGSRVVKEVVADMGGLKSVLAIASKDPGFDYDKFFRHYAALWAAQRPPELEQDYYRTDVHPLSFLRINVNVQQYDKFYETYNVQPQDKMYVEKDKRIAVW